jgi:hypothetical protein
MIKIKFKKYDLAEYKFGKKTFVIGWTLVDSQFTIDLNLVIV